MPLWSIYHTPNAFESQASRDDFAAAITASYGRLPSFYVVITFIPIPETSFYRSGKRIPSTTPFVRLVIEHLAVHAADNPEGPEVGYERARGVVDRPIQAHVIDKGYGYEYTVSEGPRELWKIDGFAPPPFQGEVFEKWKREDRVSAY